MEQFGKLYLTSDKDVLLDYNYRYKISIIKIDYLLKKGTRITILPNLNIFAEELLFDKNILISILGKKLSCKSGVGNAGEYYLQGVYTSIEIKEILYEFIKQYLLCIVCDKPEVIIKYSNNKIKQKCKACGHNDYLKNADDDIIHIMSKMKK